MEHLVEPVAVSGKINRHLDRVVWQSDRIDVPLYHVDLVPEYFRADSHEEEEAGEDANRDNEAHLIVFLGHLLFTHDARVLDEERVRFLVEALRGPLLGELVNLVQLQLHAKLIVSNGLLQTLDELWAVRLAW